MMFPAIRSDGWHKITAVINIVLHLARHPS